MLVESGVTKIDHLMHIHEITSLNDRFGRSLDRGDAEDFLSIFSNDVDYQSGPRRFNGKAELEQFFAARLASARVSRHFYSGLAVKFVGATAATGSSAWISFAGSGALPIKVTVPYMVADVQDDYVCQSGVWLIAKRIITPVFKNDGMAPSATQLEPAS